MTHLTGRFVAALEYTVAVHAAQRRKGTDIPYVAHLLAVAALALESGGDEEAAIAALLHDAPEDQGGEERLEDIRARFGGRVADIVRQCSDSLSADAKAKGPWRDRKAEYIAHVRASKEGGYLIVACADKLHNARAILQDHRVVKGRIWERFIGNREKTPEMILGYYEELAEAFAQRLPGQLSDELGRTVEELVAESGLVPDRGWVRVF
jgi:(p)ppGpp synthase/HD superfamily hydrolase